MTKLTLYDKALILAKEIVKSFDGYLFDPDEELQDLIDKYADYDFCLKLCKIDCYPLLLNYIPRQFIDRKICLEAIKNVGSDLDIIQYIPNVIPKKFMDYDFCLTMVKTFGATLEYVPEEYKNRKMCLAAIKSDSHALEYLPENFKDYKMCLAAVKNNCDALRQVPKNLIDYNMCLEAVKFWGGALEYVPEKFKDLKMCLAAIEEVKERNNCSYVMEYVPIHIKPLLILKRSLKL